MPRRSLLAADTSPLHGAPDPPSCGPEEPRPGGAGRPVVWTRLEVLAVALGLLLYAGLAVDAMRQSSATYDEPAHLSAAWTHVRLHDYRLSPDHPPLVRSLAALPLLLQDVRMEPADESWRAHAIWRFARRWLYVWNDADRLLFWSRIPIVLLAVSLIAAVFLWTRARFGRGAAGVALFLAVLSPDLLAHGHLVTTDLGAAAFIFISVVAFDAALRRTTPLRVLGAGLALGAALATKFSALALGPILLALAAMKLADSGPLVLGLGGEGRGERRVEGGFARVAVLAGLLVSLLPVATFVIWAAYGFQRSFGADPALGTSFPWDALQATHPLVHGAVHAVRERGLLPDPYLCGFLRFLEHSEARPSFLLGRLSPGGFPHFFLVTFAVKTPLPLLALFLAGVVLLALAGRQRRIAPTGAAWVALVPVLVYAALTLSRGLNIGHRHLLPLYPFVFVVAGVAGAGLLRALPRTGPFVLAGLLGWYAGGTVRVHPNPLAYFNEAAGGPANGWRVLVDSSLDWGQDLARVEPWMRARGVSRYKLSYFGSAPARHHGITGEMLPGYASPRAPRVTREVRPGDVLAVSATNLQGVYLEDPDRLLMERIRRLEPVGRIGYSILVFEADFHWPPDSVEASTHLASYP